MKKIDTYIGNKYYVSSPIVDTLTSTITIRLKSITILIHLIIALNKDNGMEHAIATFCRFNNYGFTERVVIWLLAL